MRRTGSAVESGHIFLFLYNPGTLLDIRLLFLKKTFLAKIEKIIVRRESQIEIIENLWRR